ncbi:C40 family peptidase (plasmid) [Micromonospora sp. NBC_01405]|uniref:C40 family peptidase n=1 Tax=Micromonospora sp. NBC_01405 TaxID=2903589 RepID=UPI00325497F6
MGAVGAAGKAGELITEARRHLGARYVWGKAGPDVFDCSGLVIYSLKKIGVPAPRFTTATFGTWAKANGAIRLSPDQFRAGDVILRTGHMGIATSATTMIHAPNVTTVVKEVDIYSKSTWWGWRLFGTFTAEKK